MAGIKCVNFIKAAVYVLHILESCDPEQSPNQELYTRGRRLTMVMAPT